MSSTGRYCRCAWIALEFDLWSDGQTGRVAVSIWLEGLQISQLDELRLLDSLPVVYADETHNTGENLLDEDQPVFVVAGVHLPDDAALEIVDRIKSGLPNGIGEAKYSRISRRPRNREKVLRELESIPPGGIKVSVALKRFMICSKIVDLGVEELTFADGMNMLADGSAKALANFLHLAGPVVGDRLRFEEVLSSFVRAINGRAAPSDYDIAVASYLETVTDGVDWFRVALLPVPGWLETVLAERDQGMHADTLDPAIPAVVLLCEWFGERLGDYRLMHDHSKVIERNRSTLLALGSMLNPAKPTETLPSLRLASVDLIDSRSVAQLTIADWAAGLARDAAMAQLGLQGKAADDHLLSVVEEWLASGPIWPDPELFDHLT